MDRIRAYASRTGTRRNLAALRAAGWGLFVSATGVHRHEGFPFIIDNGAWTYYQRGEPFNPEPFVRLVERLALDDLCEGVVAPDIVCGGRASLELSLAWIEWLAEFIHDSLVVYLAVQPGIDPEAVRCWLNPMFGVFVGGESKWKEETCGMWSELARSREARCHVGRVNSARRLAICKRAGVDSFDGSGPSRFEKALIEMESARAVAAQPGLGFRPVVGAFREDGEVSTFGGGSGDPRRGLGARAGPDDRVREIQTDAGVFERVGDGFAFRSWGELEAA